MSPGPSRQNSILGCLRLYQVYMEVGDLPFFTLPTDRHLMGAQPEARTLGDQRGDIFLNMKTDKNESKGLERGS